jgi:hypothetical protein
MSNFSLQRIILEERILYNNTSYITLIFLQLKHNTNLCLEAAGSSLIVCTSEVFSIEAKPEMLSILWLQYITTESLLAGFGKIIFGLIYFLCKSFHRNMTIKVNYKKIPVKTLRQKLAKLKKKTKRVVNLKDKTKLLV